MVARDKHASLPFRGFHYKGKKFYCAGPNSKPILRNFNEVFKKFNFVKNYEK
jgi:hypothetical protein